MRSSFPISDMSDEESGTASSVDVSHSLRMSESVGELHPRQHRMVLEAFEKLEMPGMNHFSPCQFSVGLPCMWGILLEIFRHAPFTEMQSEHIESDQSFERGGSKRQSITSRYLQRNTDTPSPASSTQERQPAQPPPARSRWAKDHTPIVPARILVTPATPTPPKQSQGTPESLSSKRAAANQASASPLIDDATVSKAKLLSDAAKIQNRDRRQTFAAFEQKTLSTISKMAARDGGKRLERLSRFLCPKEVFYAQSRFLV